MNIYEIQLVGVEWPQKIEDGKLSIVADPGIEWPYVTIANGSDIIFFAWFDRINYIRKIEVTSGQTK